MSQGASPTTWRRKLWAFVQIANARLRFVLLMVVSGLVAAQWDALLARWDRWTHPTPAASGGAAAEYHCPMDPQVVQNDPGHCPVCGMALSKRERAEALPLPKGVVGRVGLSAERRRLAGVGTTAVQYRVMHQRLRTVATVEVDERSMARIAARVAGRIEMLRVAAGSPVDSGQFLGEIYSPDVLTTQREYLRALGMPERRSADGTHEPGSAGPILKAARTRLIGWGIDNDQMVSLKREGSAMGRVMLRAPKGGVVLERAVEEGRYVAAGATIFTVAELSRVWVTAHVPQGEIDAVRVGQEVAVTSDGPPTETFRGEVSLVPAVAEGDTRTIRVRVDVVNAGLRLRPGMFVEASINLAANGASHPVLAIPESAVIDTGTRKVIYVEREPGVFDAVEARLSPAVDGWCPVLDGLSEGARVVTAGAFLVDAELRLRPGVAGSHFGASGATGNQSTPAVAGRR